MELTRRLKIVWAVLCLGAGLVVAYLLSVSAYKPELMQSFAIVTVLVAAAAAYTPAAPIGRDAKVAILYALVMGALSIVDSAPEKAVFNVAIAAIGLVLYRVARWVWQGRR